MKTKYWKPQIDDIEAQGVSDFDQEALMTLFCSIMQKMDRSMARKAWFDMEDFDYAHKADCIGYTLTIEKYPHAGANQWTGIFETKYASMPKSMKIFGTLELM